MLLTQAQLASKYGIGKSSICKWVKKGLLASDADGGIVETDFLLIFRKSKAWDRIKKTATPEFVQNVTGNLPLNEPNQLTGALGEVPNVGNTPKKASGEGEGSEAFSDEVDLSSVKNLNSLSKIDLDRFKAVESIRAERRKNNVAESKLIARPVVRKFIGRLGEIDNTQWRALPVRVVDDICGICGVSDASISLQVAERIEEEVFLILQNAQNAQYEFIEQLNGG